MILSRFSRSECHQAAKVLQSYLDGELDPADASVVAGHLDMCHRCGFEASAYLAIKTVISATADEVPALDREAVERLVQFARDLSDAGQD